MLSALGVPDVCPKASRGSAFALALPPGLGTQLGLGTSRLGLPASMEGGRLRGEQNIIISSPVPNNQAGLQAAGEAWRRHIQAPPKQGLLEAQGRRRHGPGPHVHTWRQSAEHEEQHRAGLTALHGSAPPHTLDKGRWLPQQVTVLRLRVLQQLHAPPQTPFYAACSGCELLRTAGPRAPKLHLIQAAC